MAILVHIALALLAAACGDDLAARGDGGATADGATGVRTVRGSVFLRHVTPSGEVAVPVDLAGFEIAALVPPEFEAREAAIGDGTFEIEGVPEGTYVLRFGDFYLETSRDLVDLGADVLGRPDAGRATQSPTILELDVENLAPWQDGDDLQAYSAGSGTVAFDMAAAALENAPVPGAIGLYDFTYDLATAAAPLLVDADAGDRLTISQLGQASDGEHVYHRLVRTFQPPAFGITDGGHATLTGNFAGSEDEEIFAFEWQRGEFDELLRSDGPPDLGPLSSHLLALHTLPEADVRGVFASSSDVVVFRSGYTEDTSLIAAEWPHAEYPAPWPQVVTVAFYTYRFVALAGSEPAPVFSFMVAELPRAAVSPTAPVRPLIGPVRNPTIEGRSAYEAVDGIGTTPTLAWDAPAVGDPSAYAVVIGRLVDAGGSTDVLGVAELQTAARRITVPPGLLQEGEVYVFSIVARESPGIDLEAAPYAAALPGGWSQIVSSPATP